MGRTLLLLAVLLVGCAKSEPPADTSATGAGTEMTMISLADVAGVWDVTVMAAGSDTAVAINELTATPEPTAWSLKVADAKTPSAMTTVPVTSVVAAGDSIVIEAGPFVSVVRPGQQVSTRTVYRLQEGRLVGTVWATYPASGETITLRTTATRR